MEGMNYIISEINMQRSIINYFSEPVEDEKLDMLMVAKCTTMAL